MNPSGKARSRSKASPTPSPPRKLTLEDVAQAVGVSRSTVSNAYNRPDQLSAALREEVLSKARALGYFGPDMMARAMRRREEIREVGVVFHHDLSYAMSDPSSIEFLRGVAKELDERHLALQLIPKMGRKLMLSAAFQTTADNLILFSDIGDEFLPEIASFNKPVVVVDTLVPGKPSVRINDRHGARIAMQHALNSAPDLIIVLSFFMAESERKRLLRQKRPGPSPFVGHERTSGYAQALRDAGFPAEDVLWINIDDQYPEESTGQRLAELRPHIPSGKRVAVVAMSDRLALAAQKELKSHRDITVSAIVGFDDIPAAAAAGLTTIRQDHYRKGQLAVQVVLDDTVPELLPVELVVRKT